MPRVVRARGFLDKFKPKSQTDDIFLAQILGRKLLGPNAALSVGQSDKDFYVAAFDSGQLASLRSLMEVFGPMCLILEVWRGSAGESSPGSPRSGFRDLLDDKPEDISVS